MFRPQQHRYDRRVASEIRTGRTRAVSRIAQRVAAWVTAAVLASTAACTSMPMAGASFGTTQRLLLVSALSAPRNLSFTGHRFPSHLYAPNIAIGDSMLRATVVRLRRLSPSFDSAIVVIENSGIPVVIGTAEQLKDETPPGYRHVDGWQALTAIYPLTADGARGKPINHFAVIVRLSDLRKALAGANTSEDSARLSRYVERVVAHEIYGHLMPQLQLGKTAPVACADPTSGADWYTACVMRRERRVMAQLVESRGTYASLGFQQQ